MPRRTQCAGVEGVPGPKQIVPRQKRGRGEDLCVAVGPTPGGEASIGTTGVATGELKMTGGGGKARGKRAPRTRGM